VLAECREDVAVEEVAVLCPRSWTYVSSALHPLACVLCERDATSAGIPRYASQFVSFDRIRIGVCVLPSLERAGDHSPADSGPDVVDVTAFSSSSANALAALPPSENLPETPSGNDRSTLFQPGSAADSPYPRTR